MTETLEARFQTQTIARTQGVFQDQRGRLGLVWGKAVPEGRGRARSYPSSYRRTAGATAGCSARCGDLHAGLRALLGERGARRPGRAGRGLLPRPRAALAVAGRHRRDRAGYDRRALALQEDRGTLSPGGTTSGGRGTGSSSSSTRRRRSLPRSRAVCPTRRTCRSRR